MGEANIHGDQPQHQKAHGEEPVEAARESPYQAMPAYLAGLRRLGHVGKEVDEDDRQHGRKQNDQRGHQDEIPIRRLEGDERDPGGHGSNDGEADQDGSGGCAPHGDMLHEIEHGRCLVE